MFCDCDKRDLKAAEHRKSQHGRVKELKINCSRQNSINLFCGRAQQFSQFIDLRCKDIPTRDWTEQNKQNNDNDTVLMKHDQWRH